MTREKATAPTHSSSWPCEEAREYSATLTGNPFLFRESRLLLGLMATQADPAALRDQVVAGNLFQYATTKSVPKRVNALLQRLGAVPHDLRDFLCTAPPSEARKGFVLVLAHHDRFFREFMNEVIAPKLRDPDERVTDADIRRYFEAKAEADPRVAGWGEAATKKLKSVITAALVEAGLLDNRKDRRVRRAILDHDTRDVLLKHFPSHYLRFLEG